MATKEELLNAINASGEIIKIVVHYGKPKEANGETLKGIQFGGYKCLEDIEYDQSVLREAIKDILKSILGEG